MKIWLTSALLFQYILAGDQKDISRNGIGENYRSGNFDDEQSRECDGDCECGGDCNTYPDQMTVLQGSLFQEDMLRLWSHRFCMNSVLYVQSCNDAHWLVCDPTETGKIAVIDAEVLALLRCFQVPTTLQEVVSTQAESATEEHATRLLCAVMYLLHLGFLHDLTREQSPSPSQKVGQTLSAWLHVTNACNLRCSYCYISKSAESMDTETSRRSIDAVIRSAVRHRYQRIALKYAGGESALSLPNVLAIHDYALQQVREHGMRLSASLLTNGTIMTQRMIEQLKDRHIRIMISLDGSGVAHDQQRPLINGQGSFRMVDRTISRLLMNHLRPSINVTVSQRSLQDLPTLLSYILERDLHFTLSYYRENDCSASLEDLQFSEAQMIDGMRSAFQHIEKHLPRRRIIDSLIDKASLRAPHHYTCGIGRNYLVINQRGGVAMCQMDIEQPVTTIQADDPLHIIQTNRVGMQAIDVDQKEGCRTCTWRYWCGGGCPLVTFRMTGRNDIRSPNCAIYKALFPEAVRLEALRLLKYENPIVL
jgi:uncharacterized protein